MIKLGVAFLISIFGSLTWAVPDNLSVSGQILDSAGTALSSASVNFRVVVLDPAETCVIFTEQIAGVNFTSSNGYFNLSLGSGTRSFPTTLPNGRLSDLFRNDLGAINCNPSGTYTPAVDDSRVLSLAFSLDSGATWNTLSPNKKIKSVAYAFQSQNAMKLGSNVASDFVLKSSLPTCSAGQVLFYNGSTMSCVADVGASGLVSSIVAGTGITTSGTSNVTVGVSFGTTAGTAAQGNDTRIVNALQTTTSFAGDVSGTASTISVNKLKGVSVSSTAPTSGQILKYDGANWAPATVSTGTVASVGFTDSSGVFSVAGSPITTSGAISLGLNTQAARSVFAAPAASAGVPSFRTLQIADIFSSIGGLSFLNTTPSCTTGTALTYVSATDRIECAAVTVADLSVTTLKLADGSVTTNKIVDGSVTTNKIADGSVSALKLGSDVGAWSLNAGNVYRNTGSVGIGTASPVTLLHVASSLPYPVRIDSTGSEVGISFFANGGSYFSSLTSSSSSNAFVLLSNMNKWQFKGDTGAFVTKSQVVKSYNSTPILSLHRTSGSEGAETTVASGAVASTINSVVNTVNGEKNVAGIDFLLANSSSASGEMILRVGANGNIQAMKLNESGNVGIGTNNPGFKLDVAGDINASGSVRSAGMVLSSDIRFKKNITVLENSLNKILTLRGVEYDWRKEEFPLRGFTDHHQIGVIAQEVEKVFPELILEDTQGYKSVSYPALVAPLIESVKELNTKKVNQVEFEKLRAENDMMKKWICSKDPTAGFCQ